MTSHRFPSRRSAACLIGSLLVLGALAQVAYALPVDGDLDLRYEGGGVSRTPPIDRTIDGLPNAAACGPTGACVLGSSTFGPDEDFFSLFFASDGFFEASGNAHFDLGGNHNDRPLALAVQRDGKIVQVGYATNSATAGNSQAAAIVRFDPVTTVLDTTFSGDGKDSVDFINDANSNAVAIAPDDKIVVAGCYETGGAAGLDFFVLRYTAAGVLDTTFDLNGIRTFGFDHGGNQDDCAFAVLVQPDGKIVVAGTSEFAAGDFDFAIARLTPTGALDPTFSDPLSGDGLVRVAFDLGGAFEFARALALDSRGRIVVAGNARDTTEDRTAIVRLLTNGHLDSAPGSFGSSGKYAPDDGRGFALGVAVAGSPSNEVYYLTSLNWIGALTGGGVVDTGFSGDGFFAFDDPLPGTNLQTAQSLAFAGGMLHVGGNSTAGANEYDILARYWMHQIFGDGFESGGIGAWLGW